MYMTPSTYNSHKILVWSEFRTRSLLEWTFSNFSQWTNGNSNPNTMLPSMKIWPTGTERTLSWTWRNLIPIPHIWSTVLKEPGNSFCGNHLMTIQKSGFRLRRKYIQNSFISLFNVHSLQLENRGSYRESNFPVLFRQMVLERDWFLGYHRSFPKTPGNIRNR